MPSQAPDGISDITLSLMYCRSRIATLTYLRSPLTDTSCMLGVQMCEIAQNSPLDNQDLYVYYLIIIV